ALMFILAVLYHHFTTASPKGNYAALPDERRQQRDGEGGLFLSAMRDYRVWILFAIYGGGFGMELFVNGRAADYSQERFSLAEGAAGIIAALFGLMNIFARSLGAFLADRFAQPARI